MVHKCLGGRAPDYLSQKFTRRLAHHDRNTLQKRPKSTDMQIKNWAAIFRLQRGYLLNQTTQRYEGRSRLPNMFLKGLSSF